MATKPRHCHDPRKQLSELRIILLGGRNSGKSCVGNIIMCVEEFVTRERTTCLSRCAEVLGRHVTVIDTPGWWCDFAASDTPELVRGEIVQSVLLSYPGPHIFLLVIKIDSVFTEKRRKAVQEHVELLGEAAWSHTCIFFSKAEPANDTSIDERIKKAGGSLKWILEKCGNRYISLDANLDSAIAQSAKLLSKIEEMTVTTGGHSHFEMDKCILQEIEDRRQGLFVRAQQRLLKVKSQRQNRDLSEPLDKLCLILLGARGSGKSSVGNTILCGQGEFDKKERTAVCLTKNCQVAGRQVTLVDTPGWWMNYFAHDSPASLKMELMRSPQLCPPGPLYFLLVVRVDKAFTDTYARAFKEHLDLLGEKVWSFTVVIFSFGDWLGDTTIEQYIESEGRALQWLVERCGNRYHVMNNKSKGDGFQVSVLLEKIEDMLAGRMECPYEIAKEAIKEVEEQIRANKERARERALKVRIKRQLLRSLVEVIKVPTDLKITLLGGKHTGKSSSGNTILSREEFEVGHQDITDIMLRTGIVTGKRVTVIKVPAWNSVPLNHNLIEELSLHANGCGVLLMVVNCSSAFHIEEFQANATRLTLLGKQLWPFTMVLFTNGDWLGGTTIEEHIESEGKPLQQLVEACGHRYHVLDNKNQGDRRQVDELLEKIEEMQVLLRLGDQQCRNMIDANLKGLPAKSDLAETNTLAARSRKSHLSHEMGKLLHTRTSDSSDHFNLSMAQERVGQLPRAAPGHLLTQPMNEPVVEGNVSMAVQLSSSRYAHLTLHGGRLKVMKVPEWLSSEVFQGHKKWTSNGEMPLFADTELTWLVMLPPAAQRQPRMPLAGNDATCVDLDTNSFNHRYVSPQPLHSSGRTETFKSMSLQALMDECGDDSIEDLEAFIDSYLTMHLQESMRAANSDLQCTSSCTSDKHVGVVDACHDVLSSIDKKLSRLCLLEELQRDLKELKSMLGQNCNSTQGFRDSEKTTVESSSSKEKDEKSKDN